MGDLMHFCKRHQHLRGKTGCPACRVIPYPLTTPGDTRPRPCTAAELSWVKRYRKAPPMENIEALTDLYKHMKALAEEIEQRERASHDSSRIN